MKKNIPTVIDFNKVISNEKNKLKINKMIQPRMVTGISARKIKPPIKTIVVTSNSIISSIAYPYYRLE